jgi:hypothetical protein
MKNWWTELGLGYKIFAAVVIVGAIVILIFGH